MQLDFKKCCSLEYSHSKALNCKVPINRVHQLTDTYTTNYSPTRFTTCRVVCCILLNRYTRSTFCQNSPTLFLLAFPSTGFFYWSNRPQRSLYHTTIPGAMFEHSARHYYQVIQSNPDELDFLTS